MKETPSSKFIRFRQEQLQRKILEASELNDEGKLAALEFQWAHRYGALTLPNIVNTRVSFKTEQSLYKKPSIDKACFQNSAKSEAVSLGNDFEKLKNENLIPEKLEELTQSREIDPKCISNEEDVKLSTHPVVLPPPPLPSLNHLRRWLPVDVDDKRLPKAS